MMEKMHYAELLLFCIFDTYLLTPSNHSSNINKVIRAILNLFFFLQEDFTHTKAQKAQKAPKLQKA